ncbi:hypothetical protein D9619_005899 [Psilocybe cf. subviscida]|uniref:Uncharacterized protein n=1 Tax=Psilocybe cf. subviscida TaxID=2480587 RepID=A0A8H5BXL1_9AGAR|nr:hypothetical protein D9619_005899 [Psilocybe cf. subviscida]
MSTVTNPPSSFASSNRDGHLGPPRNRRPKQMNISVFKNAKSPHIKNSTFSNVSNTIVVNRMSTSSDSASDPALKIL